MATVLALWATAHRPCDALAVEQDVAAPPEAVQVFDAFVQAAPVPGAAPTRRTEVRLAHDARTLFVTLRAFDPEPASIVARQMRRDVEAMLVEDQLTLVIDVEGAGRNGFLFAVNANGAQYDALVYDGGQLQPDWDATWDSEARIEPEGWSARLAIPLAVFGRSGAPTWRFNAERWMPRGSERVRLAGAQPDKSVHSLGDAVRIQAPSSAAEGLGLRVKGSLRATTESAAASASGRGTSRLEPGLELFHDAANGLRTTAALNLDFGEAEADERLVNLGRVELFRPEKREFFLRDAGRFSFGGLGEGAVMPYYSRRIGLDPQGRTHPLVGGLKLTGTVADLDVGAFAARVDGTATAPGGAGQPAADMAVLRVARPLGERHRIGMIATRGHPSGRSGSHLGGVDYQFRDTAWAGSKTLELHAWAMHSANVVEALPDEGRAGTGRSVRGQAWGGRLSYLNVGPMAEIHWQRIGPGFEPGLGYLAEANVLQGEGTVGWWHRTAGGASLTPAIDWRIRRTLDGRERSSELNPEVVYTSPAGDIASIEWVQEREQLATGHSPVPGTWIAPGRYRWRYAYALLETAQSRPVWVEAQLRAGGYYDGRRNDQWLTLGWKPDPHWGVRVGLGRNAIRLPSGRYTVRLATLRVDHTPTARWTQSLLLQWDNLSGELGVSARLRWRASAAHELLFALDRVSYTADRPFDRPFDRPGQTRATLKWVWTLTR